MQVLPCRSSSFQHLLRVLEGGGGVVNKSLTTLQGCPEGKPECDWGERGWCNWASLSRTAFEVEYILFPIAKQNSQFLFSCRKEGNRLLVLWSTFFFLSQPHFLIYFQICSYHRTNQKTLTYLITSNALLWQCKSFLIFHGSITTGRKVTVSDFTSWGQFFCWHIPRPNQDCSQLSHSGADSFRFLKLLWDLAHSGTAQPSQISERRYLHVTDWERRAKRSALICPHSKTNTKNLSRTLKCFCLYAYC